MTKQLTVRNIDGASDVLYTGQEISYVAWLPDSQHILFIDRIHVDPGLGAEAGIQDVLQIADASSKKLGILYESDGPLGVMIAPSVSPDGRHIVTSQGSGRGDACFMPLRSVFFELAPDFQSARVIDQNRFTGIQNNADSAAYPAQPGRWLSNTDKRSRLVQYALLGTGNYHPATTKLYTDFGMLTAEPSICRDVERVFMHLTSQAKVEKLTHLWLAPFALHKQVLAAIAREAAWVKKGKPGRIIAKMNALIDEATINALYAASCAGVRIDLVVRGACALRPGVKGLSENIAVRSIVGRLLEHHRIYYFRNGGADDVYLSSADWMGRNLFPPHRGGVARPQQCWGTGACPT